MLYFAKCIISKGGNSWNILSAILWSQISPEVLLNTFIYLPNEAKYCIKKKKKKKKKKERKSSVIFVSFKTYKNYVPLTVDVVMRTNPTDWCKVSRGASLRGCSSSKKHGKCTIKKDQSVKFESGKCTIKKDQSVKFESEKCTVKKDQSVKSESGKCTIKKDQSVKCESSDRIDSLSTSTPRRRARRCLETRPNAKIAHAYKCDKTHFWLQTFVSFVRYDMDLLK